MSFSPRRGAEGPRDRGQLISLPSPLARSEGPLAHFAVRGKRGRKGRMERDRRVRENTPEIISDYGLGDW